MCVCVCVVCVCVCVCVCVLYPVCEIEDTVRYRKIEQKESGESLSHRVTDCVVCCDITPNQSRPDPEPRELDSAIAGDEMWICVTCYRDLTLPAT